MAIDGPAASGKGTLARRLAERFGLAHLDTGALYRATALLVLEAAGDPADPEAAAAAARRVARDLLADPRLRADAVTSRGLGRRGDPGGARRRCSPGSRISPRTRRRRRRARSSTAATSARSSARTPT